MNCQQLALILDERDLDRLPAAERSIAQAHLAYCSACARDNDLHLRLNSLPIPSLSAARITGWRAVALTDARAGNKRRMRSRLVVPGTLAVVAAAAATLAVFMNGVPDQLVAGRGPAQRTTSAEHHEASVDLAVDTAPSTQVALESVAAQKNPHAIPGAQQGSGSFTVLVLPLQIDDQNPAARTMGEEFYSKFLEQLRQIPGLVLQQLEAKHGSSAKPADFRLKVTSGYGKVPERFGGHEQWIQNLVVEAYRQDTGSYAQVLGFSINPDCGRISPADLANASACAPSGMVEIDIQQLRRNVFPADASAARQLEARFLDPSQPQGVRRQALADLIELRQRAPGTMDPELIRVIIQDAIANAPYPAQRVTLWRALRGQSGAAMVRPLIENLRREFDDTVRLEMVGILAVEFSADPEARTELELIAKRDVSVLIRQVADRPISGETSWRTYVVSTVKDANLTAARRFEPLGWMAETGAMWPEVTRMETELHAIARQLFEGGDAVALAEVLTRASSGPTRPVAGILQIRMSSVQHPAVADFLIATVDRQADFSTFSLLGRHRADPRIGAKLKDIAANHPDANVRQLAAAQLINH